MSTSQKTHLVNSSVRVGVSFGTAPQSGLLHRGSRPVPLILLGKLGHFRHGGKFQKLTLGNALTIKLADARKRVNEMAERVRAGAKPRAADEDAPPNWPTISSRRAIARGRKQIVLCSGTTCFPCSEPNASSR
jgi:hypothetical protein